MRKRNSAKADCQVDVPLDRWDAMVKAERQGHRVTLSESDTVTERQGSRLVRRLPSEPRDGVEIALPYAPVSVPIWDALPKISQQCGPSAAMVYLIMWRRSYGSKDRRNWFAGSMGEMMRETNLSRNGLKRAVRLLAAYRWISLWTPVKGRDAGVYLVADVVEETVSQNDTVAELHCHSVAENTVTECQSTLSLSDRHTKRIKDNTKSSPLTPPFRGGTSRSNMWIERRE